MGGCDVWIHRRFLAAPTVSLKRHLVSLPIEKGGQRPVQVRIKRLPATGAEIIS